METRPATIFDTTTQLRAFDASAFDSGDEAWVRIPTRVRPGPIPFTGCKFILDRASTAADDDNEVVTVGPTGAAGRWIRWSES